jgi:hypothetical protein
LDRSEEWVPYDCFFSGDTIPFAIDFLRCLNHDTVSIKK